MTVHNNDVLFNAACLGIAAGVLHGEDFTQITAATLAGAEGLAQQATIVAAATAIDPAIPNDSTSANPMTVVATGVLNVVPFAGAGTAANLIVYFSKPQLLARLCKAAFAGQNPQAVSGTTGTAAFALLVAGIVAEYNTLMPKLATDP